MKSFFVILVTLMKFASSFDVNCIFISNDHWVVSYSDPYFCVISDVQVEIPDKEIQTISGIHSGGRSNDDVDTLRINQSPDCHYFPKGVDKFFGHLKGIMLTFTGLKTITRKDLKPFPMLKDFWIYSSKLKTLGPNLFTFNPNLKFVDFGDNRIYSISPDLFDSLRNLQEVKFNQNICINKDGKGETGIVAVKQEILERCQNGFPEDSNCQIENQRLRERIEVLETHGALLKQEVARLKAEMDRMTTFS